MGLLFTAQDWRMEVDLCKQLQFPPHITETMLRPDIVLWSDSSKQVLMLELTVPLVERMEEANERKSSCQSRGWRAKCWPVEVGCRGFAGQSLCRAYTAFGITGVRRRRAITATRDAAEKASRWLWLRADLWVVARAQTGV